MKSLISIIIALAAFGVTIALLIPHIVNFTENGPDIGNSSIFFGCYGRGPNRLVISKSMASVSASGGSTKIIRFFYLKKDAAINTVNNLEILAGSEDVKIGIGKTGFFYKFDHPENPSAILIPDDAGVIRTLPRVTCN